MTQKPERIVEVEWEDSAFSLGWVEEDHGWEPTRAMKAYGLVIQDDEKALVLAPCLDEGTSHPYGQVIAIPRSAVRKVRELRRVSAKRDDGR